MDNFENKPSLQKKRIHLIGIGNKLMCDLAIALKEKGNDVSVSDSSIPEPFYTQLKETDLLPEREGWMPENINKNLWAVVPAMHLDNTNPELIAAKEGGVLIMSLPEFIFERTKNKIRVVIAGSKQRTNMLTLVMNVLKNQQIEFDYCVNSEIANFDKYISLGYDTRIAIIEGDEYVTAGAEKQAILHFFRPHIAVITDISWNDDNQGTFDDYFQVFDKFVEQIERDGKLIHQSEDQHLIQLASHVREDVTAMPYDAHPIKADSDKLILETRFGEFPIVTLGSYDSEKHFLEQINGARMLCRQLGVLDKDFYAELASISSKM